MIKLMQESSRYVSDMVEGLALAFPDRLKKLEGNVITRSDGPVKGKAGLVSGGGSGHEPAHAGYVGDGMLDAAVFGEVFTSPGPDLILEGIKAADSGEGVLLIVKNYSGDVINFDMAKELAEMEGIQVEMAVVNDDVSIEKTEDRRGVAGTVLVHKIAGAAAAAGKPLSEVKAIAEKVISRVRTIGMALSPCYMPESGKPGFELKEQEMEIGIGIHGERGLERKPVAPAADITAELLGKLLPETAEKEVALMVNGMGGTPLSELYIAYKYAAEQLKEAGYTIKKGYAGNYMTALEMHGFSITLLPVDEELLTYLKAPASTAGFQETEDEI